MTALFDHKWVINVNLSDRQKRIYFISMAKLLLSFEGPAFSLHNEKQNKLSRHTGKIFPVILFVDFFSKKVEPQINLLHLPFSCPSLATLNVFTVTYKTFSGN